jgi:GNAT superfamily N-acetyltransferase
VQDTRLVLQRQMLQPLNLADGRFPTLRQQFEVSVNSQPGPAPWWQECVQGPIELIEFRLDDKQTGQPWARTSVWDMEGFSWRWNQPAVGLVDVQVLPDRRRRGLAKFLLFNLLRYLQDQFFGAVEVHAEPKNEPAIKLFQGLGFRPVDVGKLYLKS